MVNHGEDPEPVETVISFHHLNDRWSLKKIRRDKDVEDISHNAFRILPAKKPDTDLLSPVLVQSLVTLRRYQSLLRFQER